MAGGPPWRYYAAVLASLVSTLAWLGAAALVGYAAWAAVRGGPAALALLAAATSALLGAVFALVERQLYTREGR